METESFLNKKTKNVSHITSNTECKNKETLNKEKTVKNQLNDNKDSFNEKSEKLNLKEIEIQEYKYKILVSLNDNENSKKIQSNMIICKDLVRILIDDEIFIEFSYKDIISFGINNTKKYLNLICSKKIENIGKYELISDNTNTNSNDEVNSSYEEEDSNGKITVLFIYDFQNDSVTEQFNEIYKKIIEFNNLIVDENMDKNALSSLFGMVSFEGDEDEEDILYTEDNLKED